MASIRNPNKDKFKPTIEQIMAVKDFLERCRKNPKIDHIATIFQDHVPDCGIFHRGDNDELVDLPCLVVASTIDGEWFGLDMNCQYHYFEKLDVG